jgi:heme exporter protein A
VPAQLEDPAMPTGATASAAALVVSGLECQRGERPLFAGLDFTAPAGSIVWVRGANGRGKTTLLRTLAGLSAPSAGTIVRRGAAAGWKLLYLAHANALKEDLSVGESLAFLLRVQGDEPKAGAIDAALDCLGLASRKDAPVRTLSQGQRRRVALARLAAAFHRPGVWLLDEPYDALDVDGAAAVDAMLALHARRGGIAVLTSHLPLSLTDPRPSIVQLDAPALARTTAMADVART